MSQCAGMVDLLIAVEWGAVLLVLCMAMIALCALIGRLNEFNDAAKEVCDVPSDPDLFSDGDAGRRCDRDGGAPGVRAAFPERKVLPAAASRPAAAAASAPAGADARLSRND